MMTQLSDYDYDLPERLIAQEPLANRADARLMVIDRRTGRIAHRHVRDLAEILAPGDCLIVNDTRVVPARLIGYRTLTGGRWEGLFLAGDAAGVWKILARTRGKMAVGEWVTLTNPQGRDDIRLRLLQRQSGGIWLVRPDRDEPADAILDRVGRVPLPCYIRGGQGVPSDWARYQTVYADSPGSAAAPTAGLHFTDELLDRLEQVGIQLGRVTLHVGIDTFRPIQTDVIEEHVMHSEWGALGAETAALVRQTRQAGRRVVAVGTTSVRVLESAAAAGEVAAWSGDTNLFIRPGYGFRAVDSLLTNFHLPRSTLLVLVRTFGGSELMQRAYREAIREEYRFYSYGDAMLIL